MNRTDGRRCSAPRWPAWVALLAAWVALCAVASAQSSRPVADALERQPIHRTAIAPPATRSTDARADKPQNILDLQRILLALAVVVSLIFALRFLGKRFFPGVVAGRGSGVVRVLSRSVVAPKQQVLLVQVGRRVLVVADNGTQISPLSEITDPDEVALLLGQLTSARPAGQEAFGAAFGKAKRSFDEKLGTEPSLGSSVAENPEADQAPNESIASARGEIDGLMEKVRVLAKQLGRS